MTRLTISILLFLSTMVFTTFGQVTAEEKEILESIIGKSRTCGKIFYTSKTDIFFIKHFQQLIRTNSDGFNNKRKLIVSLSEKDRIKIIQELARYKKKGWADPAIFQNSQMVPNDSLLSMDYYLGALCLQQPNVDSQKVKVISFSRPVYFNKGNSFITYIIETTVLTNIKMMYYADYKLLLYKKTGKGKWGMTATLFSGFVCNG